MDALGVVVKELRALKRAIERMDRAGGGRPIALTYKDAGFQLSRSAKTISRMVQSGELLSIIGDRGSRLIATSELDRWIADHTPRPRARKGGAPKKTTFSVADELAKVDEELRGRRRR